MGGSVEVVRQVPARVRANRPQHAGCELPVLREFSTRFLLAAIEIFSTLEDHIYVHMDYRDGGDVRKR